MRELSLNFFIALLSDDNQLPGYMFGRPAGALGVIPIVIRDHTGIPFDSIEAVLTFVDCLFDDAFLTFVSQGAPDRGILDSIEDFFIILFPSPGTRGFSA